MLADIGDESLTRALRSFPDQLNLRMSSNVSRNKSDLTYLIFDREEMVPDQYREPYNPNILKHVRTRRRRRQDNVQLFGAYRKFEDKKT